MKIIKIITIFAIIVTMLIVGISAAYANVDPDFYTPPGPSLPSGGSFLGIVKNVINAVFIVATIVFVASILVTGIRYMVGSTEERANYKKTMIPIIVGGFMIFGITTILKIVIEIIPEI